MKKFRVWCKENNKFRYDMLIDSDGQLYEIQYEYEFTEVCMDKYIVEFSTGLKDKNGKDIYEGDIINDHFIGIGCVIFGDFGWKLSYIKPFGIGKHFGDFLESEWKCVEVIGNIHQNKDLLEE